MPDMARRTRYGLAQLSNQVAQFSAQSLCLLLHLSATAQ